MTDIRAEVRLPTKELRDDIPFFTKVLKMRMDTIYPADDPTVAVFSASHFDARSGRICKRSTCAGRAKWYPD